MAQRSEAGGHRAQGLQGLLKQAWSWVCHVAREFRDEHASLTAAAVALFGILSIFPLALLALAGGTYALGDEEEALRRISEVMQQLLVGNASATLTEVVQGVVRTRGIASFLGVLGFIWAASRVFTILVEAFDMAWDVEETRGFVKVNLIAIGLVFLSILFGILIFLAPLAIGLIARYSGRLAGAFGISAGAPGLWAVVVGLVAYAATIGLFYLLYRYVPNRHVPWQSALVGAVTAGTLWEIVHYLFQLYVVNFASYNEVYGALAGAIILILWLYYSAMILLAGAITAAVHDARVFRDRPDHPEHRGFDERDLHSA